MATPVDEYERRGGVISPEHIVRLEGGWRVYAQPCVICGTKTPWWGGKHCHYLCDKCWESIQRKEPWWLRALRWVVR